MAKDRVTIYIKGVNIDSVYNDKSLWRTYPIDAFKDKYKHRINYYKYGAMICNIGIFNLKYLRYTSTYGDLFISFSVSKLYNGNNGIPKGDISTIDLIKHINNELINVLYMNKLPPANDWGISRDESNIDIIDSIENLKQRFELIKKIKIPYRRLDNRLANKGTLYFHSGRDRNKSSAVVIVYYKGKEQQHRGNDIYNLLDLGYGNEDLRIEVKYRAHTLKRKVMKVSEKQRLKNKYYPIDGFYKDLGLYNRGIQYNIKLDNELSWEGCNLNFNKLHPTLYVDIKHYHPQMNHYLIWRHYMQCEIDGKKVNSLNVIMSKEYQVDVINEFILQCGFDKVITTKDKLYKVIDKSNQFTPTKRKAAKRVVKFLNGEWNTIDMHESTVKNYKKLILKTGYHYLYADRELKPIMAEDILGVIEQDKVLNMVV